MAQGQEQQGRAPGVIAYGAVAVIALLLGALTARFFADLGNSPKIPEADVPMVVFKKLSVHKEPREVPDLAFMDADGNAKRLSDWRGKVVLLNLWATWCAPCKVEMPSLDRLQEKLGGDKFTVLTLSTDRTGLKEPAAFFAKSKIAHLGLYNDPSSLATVQLKAGGLPLSIILNEDGREAARLLGPADWDSQEMIAQVKSFIR
jgi:thiol-disulfide isomerase/thioredoxin